MTGLAKTITSKVFSGRGGGDVVDRWVSVAQSVDAGFRAPSPLTYGSMTKALEESIFGALNTNIVAVESAYAQFNDDFPLELPGDAQQRRQYHAKNARNCS